MSVAHRLCWLMLTCGTVAAAQKPQPAATFSLPLSPNSTPRILIGVNSTALVYFPGYDRGYMLSWNSLSVNGTRRVTGMPLISGGVVSDSGYFLLDRDGTTQWFLKGEPNGEARAVRVGKVPWPGHDRYVAALLQASMVLTAPYEESALALGNRFAVEGSGRSTPLFAQSASRSSVVVASGTDTTKFSTLAQTNWLGDGPRWGVSLDGSVIARVSRSGGRAALSVFVAPDWTEATCSLPILAVDFTPQLRSQAIQEMLQAFRSTPGLTNVAEPEYASAARNELSGRRFLPLVRTLIVSKSDIVLEHFEGSGILARTRFRLVNCRSVETVIRTLVRDSEQWEIHANHRDGAVDLLVFSKIGRR